MTPIKDMSRGMVSAVPTAAEIYLYDMIDDVKAWIKKNKRSNITGKTIKPVLSKWQSGLEKVHSNLNGAADADKIRNAIVNLNAEISRILAKKDSELTFEYLVQFGSPDRSRAAFWSKLEGLFDQVSSVLNVNKQGSVYLRKGGRAGVYGNRPEPEEEKKRWYGTSRILNQAGAGSSGRDKLNSKEEPLPGTVVNIGSGGSNFSSGSSSSSGSTFSGNTSSVSSGSISKDNLKNNPNALDNIGEEVADILTRVVSFSNENILNPLIILTRGIAEAELDIKPVPSLINKMISGDSDFLTPISKNEIAGIAVRLKDAVIDNKEKKIPQIVDEIGYVKPGQEFELFGVDANASNINLNNVRVQQRSGQDFQPGSNQDRLAKSAVEQVNQRLAKIAKKYAEANSIEDLINQSLGSAFNILTKLEDNPRIGNMLDAILKSGSNFKKDLENVIQLIERCAEIDNPQDLEKAVSQAIASFQKITAEDALPKVNNISDQVSRLSKLSAYNADDYQKIVNRISGEISVDSILNQINSESGSGKNFNSILKAYSDSGNSGISIKDLQIVRGLFTREMIKLYGEMERYWDQPHRNTL